MSRLDREPIRRDYPPINRPYVVDIGLPISPSQQMSEPVKRIQTPGVVEQIPGQRIDQSTDNTTQSQITVFEKPNSIGTGEPLRLLDQAIREPQVRRLGERVIRTDIRSSMGPFLTVPEYKTHYPDEVVFGLGDLYKEYNKAFGPLVAANREWETDYQFAVSPDGTPINGWVQVDMVGLPDRFLEAAPRYGRDVVRETLRRRIFEIENSLAMYQLLENIFSQHGETTAFKQGFRASLDALRQQHGKPVALLAVTEQKHQAMRESEFGKRDGETLTDAEVQELSGFDRLFGPEEFEQYVSENGGNCDYLLYVRSSDPVTKLKNPHAAVENPLLEDDDMRRIIKAHAITFNVDNPAWSPGDVRRINDTKGYLAPMGMAYPLPSFTDLFSPSFAAHIAKGNPYTDYQDGGDLLAADFVTYLRSQGVNPDDVTAGQAALRAKPLQGTYGCYGHLAETLSDRKFRQELKKNITKRGAYVIQPEMPTPSIVDSETGEQYTYIDRNFLAIINGEPIFLSGYRSLMPMDSAEAANGRIHGNGATVWSEIT